MLAILMALGLILNTVNTFPTHYSGDHVENPGNAPLKD